MSCNQKIKQSKIVTAAQGGTNIPTQSTGYVKQVVRNADSGKPMRELNIEGKGLYRWNPLYKTYNRVGDNELLREEDLCAAEQTSHPNEIIKKQIVNPNTNKRMKRVHIDGKGAYSWNSAYRIYNSVSNYEQLTQADIDQINFEK